MRSQVIRILSLCLILSTSQIRILSASYEKSISSLLLTSKKQVPVPQSIQLKFKMFKTNLEKRSIDLDLILDGGPGKDEIPALHMPSFIDIKTARLKDSINGVLVSIGGQHRFYPYNILVWHEIVNDSFAGKNLCVTFCPLCGSAIVFDREVQGKSLSFRVSGKLYESNMLMYDNETESLWSQSRGEAVVGDYNGTELQRVEQQVITFEELKAKYPKASILSDKTGYRRDYSIYPYGDYQSIERLYFPVSVQDKRFPAKEIMYVFQAGDTSVAFRLKELGSSAESRAVGGKQVTAARDRGEILVRVDGKIVPGYIEMWFSWATQHQKDGIVWEFGK